MNLNDQSDVLLSLPWRNGDLESPDWNACIAYTKSYYTPGLVAQVKPVFERMNGLHRSVVQTFTDAGFSNFNEEFVSKVVIPYCTLVVQAQGHFPLSGGAVANLKFTWDNGFGQTDKLAVSKNPYPAENVPAGRISSLDSNVEVMSCLYNTAVGYSKVAALGVNTGSPEKIKAAFTNFQLAAGYFDLLEKNVSRIGGKELRTIGDLSELTIASLKKLSLAQAHHCGYLLARENDKPPTLLSKLAWKAGELYADVRINETPVGKIEGGIASNSLICLSAALFKARAYIHLAQAAEKNSEMGLALGYYSEASKLVGPLSASSEDAKKFLSGVKEDLNLAQRRAEKANNTVFREAIPTSLSEPTSLPAGLGKLPTNLSTSFLEYKDPKKGEDPFFGVVPSKAANSTREWRENAEALVQRVLKRAEEMQANTESAIRSLGVEDFLQSFEVKESSKIPSDLREQLLQLRNREEGNVEIVARFMDTIQKSTHYLEAISGKLDEMDKLLQEEAVSDIPLVELYGEVIWRSEYPAVSQSEVFISLSQLLKDMKTSVENKLATPLETVKRLLYHHASALSMIELSFQELELLIPTLNPNERLRAIYEGLQHLLISKEELKCLQNQAIQEVELFLQSDALMCRVASAPADQKKNILDSETAKLKTFLTAIDGYNGQFDTLLSKMESKLAAAATCASEMQVSNQAAVEKENILSNIRDGITFYAKVREELDTTLKQAENLTAQNEKVFSAITTFKKTQENAREGARQRLDAKLAQRAGVFYPSTDEGKNQNSSRGVFQYQYMPPSNGGTS